MATVFLVEVDTAFRIRDWVTTATTGVYTRTLDKDMDVVRRVEENGTALTEKTSAADVNANTSSWYYDPSTRILRVHTSDNASASSKTMLVVVLEPLLHGGTGGGLVLNRTGAVNSATLFWDNRVIALPTVSQGITPDELGSGSVATFGSLVINNADGRYDRLIGQRLFLGQQVRIYKGDDAAAYSTFSTWLIALMEEPQAAVDRLLVNLVSLGRRLDGPMITGVYSTADFANLDQNIIGFNRPKVWGSVKGAEAFRVATCTWELANHAMTSIDTASVKTLDGTAVTVISTILGSGQFTAATSYADTEQRLYADGRGYALDNPGDLFIDVAKNFGLSTVSDLDSTALTQLNTDRAVKVGFQVRTGSVRDVFDLIARSAFVDWFVTRSNTISGQIRARDQGNQLSNGTFETGSTGWVGQRGATISTSTSPVFLGSQALEIAKAAASTVAHGAAGDLRVMAAGGVYTVTLLATLTSGAATTAFRIGMQDGGVNEYLADGVALSTGGWTRVTHSLVALHAGFYAATTELFASSTVISADSIGDAIVVYPQHGGAGGVKVNIDAVEMVQSVALDDANAQYSAAIPRGPVIWRARAGYAFDGRLGTRRYAQNSDTPTQRLFPTAESRQIDGNLVCTTDAEVVALAVINYYSVARIRVTGDVLSPENEPRVNIGSVLSLGTTRLPSLPGAGKLFRVLAYSERYDDAQVPRLSFEAEAQTDPVFAVETITAT